MIVELDTNLAPIAMRQAQRETDRSDLFNATFSEGARTHDWRTQTTTVGEVTTAHSIPDDAPIYHKNYLEYLETTYGKHYDIVLAPQVFWYTVLTEIAQAVKADPERHRPLFTKSPEPIKIIVAGPANGVLPLHQIRDALTGLVPVDIDKFLPEFTTSTPMSRLACIAAFAETVTPFYSYGMLACGHPRIRVDGTEDDWVLVLSRIAFLTEEFQAVESSTVTEWLSGPVTGTARMILECLQGGDTEPLGRIFKSERCGSGSQREITGWWSRLFIKQPRGHRFIDNFSTQITRVPYTDLNTNKEFILCFGLFYSAVDQAGFYVPEFAWVQNEILKEKVIETEESRIKTITVDLQTRRVPGTYTVEIDHQSLVAKNRRLSASYSAEVSPNSEPNFEFETLKSGLIMPKQETPNEE